MHVHFYAAVISLFFLSTESCAMAGQAQWFRQNPEPLQVVNQPAKLFQRCRTHLMVGYMQGCVSAMLFTKKINEIDNSGLGYLAVECVYGCQDIDYGKNMLVTSLAHLGGYYAVFLPWPLYKAAQQIIHVIKHWRYGYSQKYMVKLLRIIMNICYSIMVSITCFFMINAYGTEIDKKYASSKKNDGVVIDIQFVVENDEEDSPFKKVSARSLFLGYMATSYLTGFALDSSFDTRKALFAAFSGWGCTGFVLTGGDLTTAIATGDIRRRFGSTDRFAAIMAGSAVGLLAGIGTSAYWRLLATNYNQEESSSQEPFSS